MKKNIVVIYAFAVAGCVALFASCGAKNNTVDEATSAKIQNEVKLMTLNLADDLGKDGPSAWLKYFEKTPTFYMASGGMMAFPNNDSATSFVQNILVKHVKTIRLLWNQMRVDPLTPTLADVGAFFSETLFDYDNMQTLASGYFTATAEKTKTGWQIRNCHWSLINGTK